MLAVTPVQKRHKFTLAASNRGVASLGDGQLDGRAEFYGLANDGDVLSVSGSAAADFDRFLYGSLGYATPIGGDGLTASASTAYLKTRPRRLNVEGTAKQVNLSLSYPLIRDFHRAADVVARPRRPQQPQRDARQCPIERGHARAAGRVRACRSVRRDGRCRSPLRCRRAWISPARG